MRPDSLALEEQTIPDQYEVLLDKLSNAERELENPVSLGHRAYLEEASAVVFDLLYSLDFKNGGELVPRLAALYGYIANELLSVARTGNRDNLVHIHDMIATLSRSWHGQRNVA